jgi:hypothetical protein
MAKKLVYNYTFDASAGTIRVKGNWTLRTLILITNVTDNIIIYNFADATAGGTVSYNSSSNETTISLVYNTTSMSDGDELQILVDEQDAKIDASESLLDPVHKFRVSNPQNLIDTDFEYGLQPTKWETIELVDNIPSVYSRGSGVSIGGISQVNTINGSNLITVSCTIPHELSAGDPIEVRGLNSRTANGKYIITSTPSTTRFVYKAGSIQLSTGNVATVYTTIIPGSFFSGSTISYDPLQGIETNYTATSTLSFSTDYYHGLSVNTGLYITNTVGKRTFTVSATGSNAPDGSPYVDTSNDTFYIANHAIAPNQTLFISSSTSLPSTTTGAPEPTTTSAITSVFERVNIACDNIVATIRDSGSVSYPGQIILNYGSSSFYPLYTNTNYTTISNPYSGGITRQDLIWGDYADGFDDEILFYTDTSGGYRSWFSWDQTFEGNTRIYTGEAVDLGQYFNRRGWTSSYGTPPSTLSNLGFYFIATHYVNNVYVPYIVTVRQLSNPADVSSQYNRMYLYNYNAYRTKYARSRSINSTNYNTFSSQNWSFYNNGWQGVYRHVITPPTSSYAGYLNITMEMQNSNWDQYINDGFVYWSGSRMAAYNYRRGGPRYVISVIVPLAANSTLSSQSLNYFGNTGFILSRSEMFNEIATSIADNVTIPSLTTNNQETKAVVFNDNRIKLSDPNTGIIYDLTSTGSGTITLNTPQTVGVVDDYYNISGIGSTSVTINTSNQIDRRVLDFAHTDVIDVDGNYHIYITNGHGLQNGQRIRYALNSGSVVSGLSNPQDGYAVVLNDRYFTIVSDSQLLDASQTIITGPGSGGSHYIYIDSISGRVASLGTISGSSSSKVVTGENTSFTTTYIVGDKFITNSGEAGVDENGAYLENIVESVVSDTSLSLVSPLGITTSTARHYVETKINVRADGEFLHRPFDGGVEITAGRSPDSTIVRQTRKYFRYQSGKGIQCSMAINFNPARPLVDLYATTYSAGVGYQYYAKTEYPHGLTADDYVKISNTECHSSYTPSTATYNPSTGYLVLTISSASTIFNIGEYVYIKDNTLTFTCDKDSNATNHSYPRSSDPAGGKTRLRILDITANTITVDVGTSSYAGNHTFVSAVSNCVVHIDTSNTYNGIHQILSVTADTFTFATASQWTTNTTHGFPEYAISTYNSAGIRAGLFDFQNGFFYEYDGKKLYAVRRSSVQQLSGTATVVSGSHTVLGDSNSSYDTQLKEGDLIVLRGQTHKITGILGSDTLYVQPEYRGSSSSGLVITKTVDTKVAQSDWNIDNADGTGPSGYVLDINKIQMVYLDYSWYGAGKIRFGFKDTNGHVKYMHEFIHNNLLNEAYMRSGNVPARYEVFNKGIPTFIPSLFHWGTSVIMDGGFDDDDSYLFTASGNTLTFTNGDVNTATTTGAGILYETGRRYKDYYLQIPFSTNDAAKFSTGIGLWNSTNTLTGQTVNFTAYSGSTFYVYIYLQSGYTAPALYPTVSSGQTIYIGGPSSGGSDIDLTNKIPLISIRLSPSADNNLIGNLGEKDIINRMQLKMKELGISVSHDANIDVILNGSLSNLAYSNVGSPSLSQYIAHVAGDVINEGTTVYSFRASGGATDITGKRLVASNAFDLSQLTDLGNSILGGDGVFPNGPDIVTITATVINTSEIDSASSFQVSSRLSWAESQA